MIRLGALWAVFGLCLPSVAAADGPPPPLAEALVEARQSPTLPAALDRVTKPLLGAPYVLSPLGEGEGADPDPRLRWDAFDCLTFVETALAAATAGADADVLPLLDDLRYADSPPSFLNRNHFVEAQWLPSNVLKGWLVPVSRDVAGPRTVAAWKEFGPERWNARKQLKEMPLAAADVPRGTWRFEYAPLDVVRDHPERIADGTILFVVRKDFYTQPTRITHVGFVFVRKGVRYLRHAANKPYQRVVDEPLASFVKRNSAYDKWPVEGFSLYRPQRPAGRLSTRAAP